MRIAPTQKANKVFASATGKARPNKEDEEIIRIIIIGLTTVSRLTHHGVQIG